MTTTLVAEAEVVTRIVVKEEAVDGNAETCSADVDGDDDDNDEGDVSLVVADVVVIVVVEGWNFSRWSFKKAALLKALLHA